MLWKHLILATLALLTISFLLWIDSAGAKMFEVKVTSYNPEVGQTDSSPCTAASGRNLCIAAKEGDRVIALSRDLLKRNGGHWEWHDKIRLTSKTPACNGVFSVEDTMNARYQNRVDLFFLARSQNVSCVATLSKV